MRPGLIFLLKLLAASLALFLLWPFLAPAYGRLLTWGLALLSPEVEYTLKTKWIYNNSLFLVPLGALLLATPLVRWWKKAGSAAAGIVLLAGLDTLRIHFEIGDNGPSAAYAIYHSCKLLIPLGLWAFLAYPALPSLFRQHASSRSTGTNGRT